MGIRGQKNRDGNFFQLFEGNFKKLPKALGNNGNVSVNAKAVTWALALYEPSFPSYEYLQAHTGLGRTAISKALKELKSYNVIDWEKGHSNKVANNYFAKPESEWTLPAFDSESEARRLKDIQNKSRKKSSPIASEPVSKTHPNETKLNKTNINKTKRESAPKTLSDNQLQVLEHSPKLNISNAVTTSFIEISYPEINENNKNENNTKSILDKLLGEENGMAPEFSKPNTAEEALKLFERLQNG